MRLKAWKTPLKVAVALAAAYLVYRKVPFASVGPAMSRCRPELLAVVILMNYATSLAQAWRWKLFLRDSDLPVHKFLYFIFMGLFVNLFLPTSLAADAVKVVAFGRKYGDTQRNIGITLLAKLQGMLVQLALGGIGMAMYARELRASGAFERLHFDLRSLGLAVAAGLVALAVLWTLRKRLSLGSLLRSIGETAKDPVLFAKTFAISASIQILSSVWLYLLILSVYPETHFWQTAFFGTVIQAVLLLPFAFGGVGVREYITLLLFTEIGGIPADSMLAASLLGYIPWLLMALTGGVWMALRKNTDAPPVAKA